MSDTLRCLIVDDEPMAIERLQLLLADMDDVKVAGTAGDGASALRLLDAVGADLVFLDIEMPGLDGIAVAEALAKLETRPAVVFATAFDRFAVRAFDVAAIDYLLKPVGPQRLRRAIERAQSALSVPSAAAPPSPYATEFWVPHRSEMIRVDVRDIDHIEAERDYMRLHVGDHSHLIHHTLAALEEQLDPDLFIRVHRSHIVAIAAVKRLIHEGLGVWSLETERGRRIRIGRTHLPDVRKRITGR